jgi:glycosyltransferase involved in cell wall biosynthesis
MKILMINDSLILGGRERRFVEVIKGLVNRGYEIEIVILRNAIDYPIIYQYVHKVHILERKIKKDPRIFFKMYRIYKEFKPDIIHSWGSQGSIYCMPILFFNRIKLLNAMIADSSCKKYGKEWIRAKLTFLFSSIILSNSYAGLKAYGAYGKKNAYVIHNGYDFNRSANHTDPDVVRKQLNITTTKVVGMIAAFHIRRDYRTYLEAANILCKKYSDLTFLCIGDGVTEEEHKKMVSDDLIGTRIKFLGFQKNVEAIINIMDISVLLVNANLIQEGLSNAIVESMAHSKPVIATNSGGSHEIVIDGETGYFVEPYSVNDLVEKLELLLNNNELCLRMGAKGFEQISRNFSYDHMINATIDLYQKIRKH